MNLLKEALTLDLVIRKWHGRKHDRDASAEINALKKSDKRAARVNRPIVPTSFLSAINAAESAARSYEKNMTVPWMTARNMFPASQLFTITHELNNFKARFESAKQDLLNQHSLLPAIAKQHLGDMYNPDDLPSIAELEEKFSFEFHFEPVPQVDDWRATKINEMSTFADQYKERCDKQTVEIDRYQIQDLLQALSAHLVDLPSAERVHSSRFEANINLAERVLAKNALTSSPEVNRAAYFVINSLKGIDLSSVSKNRDQAIKATSLAIDFCNSQLEIINGVRQPSQSSLHEMFNFKSNERPVHGLTASAS